MAAKAYRTSGQVIEQRTRRGIAGLRVEAWDKDEKYDDLLGVDTTDGRGRFQMDFDQTYFREFSPDLEPELYFKVFRRKQLLKSTRDSVIVNANQQTEVTIEIETAQLPKVSGKDRISARQIFKAADFLKQSDFRGVWREGLNKIQTSFNFVSDIAASAVTDMDFEPVQVKGPKEREVIDQDVATAGKALKAKGVVVAEVKPYDPKLNRQALKNVTRLPAGLKAGQQVILYEQAGKVRYYALVPEKAAAEVNKDHLTQLSADMQKMRGDVDALTTVKKDLTSLKSTTTRAKTDLTKKVEKVSGQLTDTAQLSVNIKALQEASTQKDKTISTLEKEVAALRAAHADLLKKVDAKAITRMAADIKKLQESLKE